MRLTVTTFVSLDGVMQAPGDPDEDRSGGFGAGGWVLAHFDEQLGGFMSEVFSRASAFLLGRTTFELFATHWPQVTDPDDVVAARLNSLPKYVASTTVTSSDWAATTFLSGDVPAEVARLKAEGGDGELQVHGSAGLLQTLVREGLVDEYAILTFPVLLGGGKRMFEPGPAASGLRLVDSFTTAAGVQVGRYEPAGALRRARPVVVDGVGQSVEVP